MEARHIILAVAALLLLPIGVVLGFGDDIDAAPAAVDPDWEASGGVVPVAIPAGGNSHMLPASPAVPTLLAKGSVIAFESSTQNVVARIQIPIISATSGPVDLSGASLVVTYMDINQTVNLAQNTSAETSGNNPGWDTSFRAGDTGPVLDPGERADFWVNLQGLTTQLGPSTQFTIQIKPAVGEMLEGQRTTGLQINTINNLGYESTAPPSLSISSSVLAHEWSTFDVIERIQIPIVTATGTPVDLSAASLVVTYIDQNQLVDLVQNTGAETAGNNTGWDTVFGAGDTGPVLDPGEQADFWVNLSDLTTQLGAYTEFIIQIKPAAGGLLEVRRTTPGQITAIIDLGDEITTPPTIMVKGSVIGHESSTDNVIERVQIPIAVPFGTTIDLSVASLTVTYADVNQTVNLVPNFSAQTTGINPGWNTVFRTGDTDPQLDTGERADFWVNLSGLTTPLGPSTQFTIQIKPAGITVVEVQRTTPAEITAVLNLGYAATGPPALSNPSSVVAHESSTSNVIERIQIPIVTAISTPVDLSSASLVVTYIDANQVVDFTQNTSAEDAGNNPGWNTIFSGGDGGPVLDPGEQADLWLNLQGLTTQLGPLTQFTIQIKPYIGSILEIQRTTPAEITIITDLGTNPVPELVPSMGLWSLVAMASMMAVFLAWRARLAHRQRRLIGKQR